MNLETLQGIPCPWCAIQGVRVELPASGICPRCRPNYRRPARWRRLVRALTDWLRADV